MVSRPSLDSTTLLSVLYHKILKQKWQTSSPDRSGTKYGHCCSTSGHALKYSEGMRVNFYNCGHDRFKWSIYLQHFSSVMVAQKDCMPCKSSSLFLGLAVVRTKFFISCHRFSIGFKFRLSGGVFSTLILLGKPVLLWRCGKGRCPVGQ